jgi:hypothetical protein
MFTIAPLFASSISGSTAWQHHIVGHKERWISASQARRMKDLEKENLRLGRAISNLTLDKLILQEAARGNF